MTKTTKEKLVSWYRQNKRPWPWRLTKDPYLIWISEVMLQQTTSAAVAPMYTRFTTRFPTLRSLATAPVEDVLEHWSGLGYYSRARNLHKAALALNALKSFPKTFSELIEYPGFGPYTSRSVASLAFEENVGVIDGNVIRVLSRWTGERYEWWITKDRQRLQNLVDAIVVGFQSSEMNQALMELGATVCLPKTPRCLICPIAQSCVGLEKKLISVLPIKKEKRAQEIWLWQVNVEHFKSKVKLVKNDYAPFLRDQWFLPGQVKKLGLKPKTYSFKHSVTHHDIYVQVDFKKVKILGRTLPRKSDCNEIWIESKKSKSLAPTNLVQKVLRLHESMPRF